MGDLAPGLERAAQWHDARCKGPDVFEQELHEVSAKALRHLAANPDATDMQALDAGQSAEGRSNGAGEDVDGFAAFDMGYAFGLSLRGQTMEDSRAVGRLLWSGTFKPLHEHIKAVIDETGFDSFQSADNGIVQCKRIIRDAFARLAALSAPQGEVERLRARIGTLEDALTKAGEWLDYENSPMGPAETKAYHRLMAQIDAALAQPEGDAR
ncbi:hypothetical protein [Sphingopyxis flava]|uniref:Uncharacterized protein n=1 Tax=Sphingopyxis flava TaxID=1507287 RepID=A0A1T5AC86_9SPHN|nr:hypothetical protein [Sphingopyxis flava]SKB32622.1 hypothetical protein SAMN06295937_100395 [Sphingopyxis flava]